MAAGANILLAHFHYCNKGIYPFSEGCKDQDLRTLAGLDEEKIQFVHATRANAKQNSKSNLVPPLSSTESLGQR